MSSSPAPSPSPSTRAPTYFLSIGGPNFIENTTHPAYTKLRAVGQEITHKIKPKAIVVFSAHWQSDAPNKIQVNAAEDAELIYDFYGFPKSYYEVEYPNRGSREVAERVAGLLEGSGMGIEVERVRRGLDHGVWVGFLAAFDPKTNPLNIPIIQVSLFSNLEDPQAHYRLGTSLARLRSEDILIIAAGMAVHNLHDFRAARARGLDTPTTTMPYVFSFDDALKEAVTSPPEHRKANMLALLKRSDARRAHPTLEHLMPVYVAAGAADGEVGEQVWTMAEGSLSWAQYRFGRVGGGE